MSVKVISLFSTAVLLASTAGLVPSAPTFAQSGQPDTRQTKKTANHKPAAKPARHGNLTDAQALALVEKLPAVIAWKKGCLKNGAKAKGVTLHVGLDRKEGSTYFVHVYEDVPDDGGSSHSATFNC